jgi:hypothetical protein
MRHARSAALAAQCDNSLILDDTDSDVILRNGFDDVMTKQLPLSDFRAVRWILEPDDFALSGDDGDDPPPTDPVDQETWHGIMDLPDDVAIRTSDHHGRYLKLLERLQGDWIKAVGTFDLDELSGCMLGTLECFQCATFDFLHGYYRSALSNLRSALELTIIGVYGNINPTGDKYQNWKNGSSLLSFTPTRREVWKVIRGHPNDWILQDGQILASVFNELCRFTHCRPDATDGDIWEGNGPVYSKAGVRITLQACLQAYAICYLLIGIARPNFRLPSHSRVLFKIDWLEAHAQLSKAFREFDR